MGSVFLVKPYARALFELGKKQNRLDAWLESLRELSEIVHNDTVTAYLTDPGLSFRTKSELLSQVMPDMSPVALNMVFILLKHGALRYLPEIINEFQNMIDSENRIARGEVTSVEKLDEEEMSEIARNIGKIVEKQVVLHDIIDKNLIGGMTVRVDDTLFDGTIINSLGILKQKLGSQS